jgi:hypothetical protein
MPPQYYDDGARKRIDATVLQHEADRFHERSESGLHRTPIPVRSVLELYNLTTCAVGPAPLNQTEYIPWTPVTTSGGIAGGAIGSGFTLDTYSNANDWITNTTGRDLVVEFHWNVTIGRTVTALPGDDKVLVRVVEFNEGGAGATYPKGQGGYLSTSSVSGGYDKNNSCSGGMLAWKLDAGHGFAIRLDLENDLDDTFTVDGLLTSFSIAERDSYPPPSTLT